MTSNLLPRHDRYDYSSQVVHRQHTGREFCDMLVDQFEEMVEQSAKHPLVCNISIHPYVFGSGVSGLFRFSGKAGFPRVMRAPRLQTRRRDRDGQRFMLALRHGGCRYCAACVEDKAGAFHYFIQRHARIPRFEHEFTIAALKHRDRRDHCRHVTGGGDEMQAFMSLPENRAPTTR